MKDNLIKLDYGSGYQPKPGFKTADICGRPDYYVKDCEILDMKQGACRLIRLKNVFHHVLDSKKLDSEMKRVISENGKLIVIEPTEENYESNKFWDGLWYRGIIPRPEIVWSEVYRDPVKYFPSFQLISRKNNNPYEILIFTPRS